MKSSKLVYVGHNTLDRYNEASFWPRKWPGDGGRNQPGPEWLSREHWCACGQSLVCLWTVPGVGGFQPGHPRAYGALRVCPLMHTCIFGKAKKGFPAH